MRAHVCIEWAPPHVAGTRASVLSARHLRPAGARAEAGDDPDGAPAAAARRARARRVDRDERHRPGDAVAAAQHHPVLELRRRAAGGDCDGADRGAGAADGRPAARARSLLRRPRALVALDARGGGLGSRRRSDARSWPLLVAAAVPLLLTPRIVKAFFQEVLEMDPRHAFARAAAQQAISWGAFVALFGTAVALHAAHPRMVRVGFGPRLAAVLVVARGTAADRERGGARGPPARDEGRLPGAGRRLPRAQLPR